ncbi:MAG: ferric reductase-like transmembrane domain-containing protein [Gaiellaceae bacterium]
MLSTSGPTAFWYLTRGSGVVAMLLLTLVVVLGVTQTVRWRSERWPRFIVAGLHRNVTLLAIVFLVVHVVTTLADGFAPIGLKDVFIPFAGRYRPLWLGFGALALDLLLALTITSLLRARVGQRLWRGLHWLAYAAWPFALVHGLGTGSDTKVGWMLVLTFACIFAVVLAILWRLVSNWQERTAIRLGAGVAALVSLIVIFTWFRSGPLRSGWAARAGTPRSLLAGTRASLTAATVSEPRAALPAALPSLPFSARLAGNLTEGQDANGLVTVRVKLRWRGGGGGWLQLALRGEPLEGGGVAMSQSAVTFGPLSQPGEYSGTISALEGTRMQLSLANGDGSSLRLQLELQISQDGTVSGVMHARRSGGSGGLG